MDSPSLIHARLGHPSIAKMQQLVPSLSNVSTLSCQLGKHICNSFPSSVSQRTSSLFALVHSNIWGPSCIKSSLGF